MSLNDGFYYTIMASTFMPLLSVFLLSIVGTFQKDLQKREMITLRIVQILFGFALCSTFLSAFLWFMLNEGPFTHAIIDVPVLESYLLHFQIFVDGASIAYATTAAVITNIIVFFSHRYLHRDPGFLRFFIVISLFYLGINLILIAGSLDLIFAGWEIVGISSFLLIGYFWHRPKAIVAANRAYYIFRICDLGLLAGVLIAHAYWHEANLFGELLETNKSMTAVGMSLQWQWLLSLAILLPVLGKSAQFPLCFWLPKAMEGPTHSSAIFYGSLSIHAGVFLLLRTTHIWYETPGFTYLLGTIGLITALCATLFAHVQSNIKGQIGYASVAQVGVMLIELSLGLWKLAIFHMVGNAFLRCFQLLVSSSILTSHMQLQSLQKPTKVFYGFSWTRLLPTRLRPSLFAFALNEGYFERLVHFFFVKPVLFIASYCHQALFGLVLFNKKKDNRINREPALFSFAPFLLLTFFGASVTGILFNSQSLQNILLLIGIFLCFASMVEKKHPERLLMLVIISYASSYLSVVSLPSTSFKALIFAFGGLICGSILSLGAMGHILKRRRIDSFASFLGLFHDFPFAGVVLLLGGLSIMALPLSTSFFGEDMILHLSVTDGPIYPLLLHFIFVINGISVIRMISHVLFGKKPIIHDEPSVDYSPLRFLVHVLFFIIGNFGAYGLFF